MTTTASPASPRPLAGKKTALPAAVWDSEVLVLQGESRPELLDRVRCLDEHLERHPDLSLADLGHTLRSRLAPGGSRLALVVGSLPELRKRLARALERLQDPTCDHIRDTSGIYFFSEPLGREGKLAFLFPGEGSQYPGMLRDVAPYFSEVQEFFHLVDEELTQFRGDEPPLTELFQARKSPETEQALRRLDNAMLSVLVADGAIFRILEKLQIRPDFLAGHSMGEMAALSVAGASGHDEGFLGRFASTMGQLHRQEMESDEDCLLLAVGAGREKIAGILADPSIHMAMDNCPHQTVLVGPREAMERVHLQLQERGLICEKLSFRRPYHTPLFEPLLGPLKELFAAAPFNTPTIPVYSCTTAQPFPADPDAIRDLAVRHWAAPLRFREMIEEMHRAGARLFVEVGPRGNLTSFVEDILRGKQHIALPSNAARRSGLSQLNHLIAQLAAHDVRFDLASHHGGRTLNEIALPWDASALEDAVPQPVDLAPATYSEPTVESVVPRGRAEVMNHYLAVMEQFLEMQQEVTEAYLSSGRSHRPTGLVSPHDLPPLEEAAPTVPDIRFRPLLGEVVNWVPGQELVARRRLDLEEDLFALDHTVGGRAVSKVDPEQHGVPVTPMTFTLEILAEAGSILAPGHVVTAIKQIRLLRWLAYEFDEPGMIEVSARVAPTSTPGEIHVMAEIRDLGPADHPHPRGAKTAEGMVVLAPCYAPPPPSEGLPVANIKPVDMTVEQVYHNLFHGPSFQGVKKTVRGGDEGIEAEVEVLPRDQLFRSIPDPVFQMDPVLLDVVLHPLATWHLHQADLAGRIMLPVGVDAVEFFAPPAVPGTRYLSRAWVSEANLRSFSHRGETATPDGNVYIRLDGVKCWRFYVPFGEDVNFHGPKDQYFLGRRWSEIEKQTQPDSANPSVLVRLEIPADLKQAAMNRVTAQVTLTKQELREFSRLTRAGGPVHPWLFDRIAAKDAMRLLFFEKTGERLFPADMECQEVAEGRLVAHRRKHPDQPLGSAVLARAGQVTVAMTADGPIAGLALEILDEAESPEDLRDSCVAQAIRSTGVLPAEAEVGAITWISETLARATLPQGETWLVHFARDEDYLVAWTRGEKGSP